MEIEGKMYNVNGFGGKIANEFNQYFNDLPRKQLAENGIDIEEETDTAGMEDMKSGNLNSLELNVQDVEKAIHMLKNKKFTGQDGVSVNSIKNNAHFFAKLLA